MQAEADLRTLADNLKLPENAALSIGLEVTTLWGNPKPKIGTDLTNPRAEGLGLGVTLNTGFTL